LLIYKTSVIISTRCLHLTNKFHKGWIKPELDQINSQYLRWYDSYHKYFESLTIIIKTSDWEGHLCIEALPLKFKHITHMINFLHKYNIYIVRKGIRKNLHTINKII
jgi:hypothetical protein